MCVNFARVQTMYACLCANLSVCVQNMYVYNYSMYVYKLCMSTKYSMYVYKLLTAPLRVYPRVMRK